MTLEKLPIVSSEVSVDCDCDRQSYQCKLIQDGRSVEAAVQSFFAGTVRRNFTMPSRACSL
jgi:hypothetical protein